MPSVPVYLDQYKGLFTTYSVDIPALIAVVAGQLGITEEQASPAVYAAIDYILLDTGLGSTELSPDDVLLNSYAIPLLAQRIYQDTANPGGETNQFDPTFAGIFTPLNLYSHVDQYYAHLRVNTGLA